MNLCVVTSSSTRPFSFFYTTIFTKIRLRLPLSFFEKALLTELNVTLTQLHSNSWVFIRTFVVLCSQFDISPTVDVLFFIFFEFKSSGRQLWVSLRLPNLYAHDCELL